MSISLLPKALLANAVFSASSAVMITLLHESLSLEIPLSSVYWLVIAVGLGLFAGQLVLMAASFNAGAKWVVKLTPSVVIADGIWVVGSFALALVFYDQITVLGLAIISGVNIFVGALALLQFRGWKYER